VRLKESEWENHEIADLEPIAFMKQAEGRYKVMTEKGTWAKPTKDEADIMALAACIDSHGNNEKMSESQTGKERKAGKPGGGQRPNEGEWAWKNKALGASEPKEKTFKGKTYVACKFHKNTQWVLKDGHTAGCRNDPNFGTGAEGVVEKKKGGEAEPEKKLPSKKALQFAHALMAAMEHENDGGFGEEEAAEPNE
jgi:hypothetical protein